MPWLTLLKLAPVVAAVGYFMYAENRIDNLRAAKQELTTANEAFALSNGQLTEAMSRQKDYYENQLTARNNTAKKYREDKAAAEREAADLRKLTEELKSSDPVFEECATRALPDSYIDSLYNEGEGSSTDN